MSEFTYDRQVAEEAQAKKARFAAAPSRTKVVDMNEVQFTRVVARGVFFGVMSAVAILFAVAVLVRVAWSVLKPLV